MEQNETLSVARPSTDTTITRLSFSDYFLIIKPSFIQKDVKIAGEGRSGIEMNRGGKQRFTSSLVKLQLND